MFPTAISLRANGEFAITWEDGQEHVFQAAWLRKRCPCAHCNEERKNPKPTDLLPVISASEAQPLTIDDLKPLGNYAYTISFSDGHNTGIYEISVLRELGESL